MFVHRTQALMQNVSLVVRRWRKCNFCNDTSFTKTTKTPELYHTINLSCHNSDVDCKLVDRDTIHRVPSDFVKRRWTRLDCNTFEKQTEFVRTLTHTPGLGKHVRELHRTAPDLFDWDDEVWEDARLARETEDVQREHERDGFATTPPGSYGMYIYLCGCRS
jgi:hypothetical protein